MLIDWFTVFAQVINFLVLAWLLKRFLYHPILNAIDAREKRIEKSLAGAAEKMTEAQKQRDEFQQKNAEYDNEHAARLGELTEEIRKERARLLDEARDEAEALRRKLQLALKSEQLSLQEALNRRAQEEVFAIARKALDDLAGVSLEERMTDIFISRLSDLDPDEVAALKSAFQESATPLLVRTAFALPEPQRVAITAAIRQLLGYDAQVDFAIAAELVSGIELVANGQKIAWSIADYLDLLAKSVSQLLQDSDDSQVAVAAAEPAAKQKGDHEQHT